MTNPEQDFMHALAVSPNFPADQLVFAGRRSGLYRSRDAGKSWEPCRIIAGETVSVTALAFSLNFANDRTIFAALTGAVAYSNDAGGSWLWTRLSSPPPYVSALAVSPDFEEDKTLFAATLEDGILRSADGGLSWQAWNFGLLDKQVFCLAINSESVYAGTGTGLFHSHNSGRSWQEVTLPVEDAVLSLGMMGEYLFVGTETHGLFISIGGTKSWRQINARGLDTSINQIQVVGGNETVIRVLAGNALMESKDEGKTWQKIRLPSMNAPIMLATPLVGFSSGLVITC